MKLYTLFIKTFLWSRLIRTKPFTVNWLLSKFYTPKELRIMGPEYDSINEKVFTRYKKLTRVIIIDTSITKLPDSLFELENFNSLVLVKNEKLTDFSQLEKLKNNEKFKLLQITNTTMSKIPESVFSLTQLDVLWLHSNKIEELSYKLFKLNNLEQLELSNNKISKIPSDIQNLENLKSLNLHQNLIKEIPEELFNLTELEILYFSNNSIEAISDNIKNLNNLKIFSLANNKIKEIPEALCYLDKLERIDFSNTLIGAFPDNLKILTNLMEIYLENNKIKEIPEALCYLDKLEIIDFSNNLIEAFPDNLKILTNLKEIYLENNKIKEIPEALCNLTKLVKINFSNNLIGAFPDNLKNLNNLKIFTLANNKIKEIPEALCNLAKLEIIDFSNNLIEAFPVNLKNLKYLKNIYLGNNKIKKIPEALCYLTKLEIINFSNNLIGAFPDNLKNLINLKNIYLGDNKLEEIPEALFKLKSLSMLDLSYNYLKLIPESIGNLKYLERLNLAHNQITMLPKNFAKLNKLCVLYLQTNNIVIIPNEILKLSNLEFLNFSNNEISKIPSIIKKSGFRELNLSDNFILKEYLATTSNGELCLKSAPPFKVLLGDQHKKTTFEEVIQSLKKEKYYWNIDELARIKHTEDVLEKAKYITDKQMRKMWREVLKHLVYEDSGINAEPHDQKSNKMIDFDTNSNEEDVTSASSITINTADQRNNETDQLKVIDATNSPCNSEILITVCDTNELNTTSSITESLAGLIKNLKTKLKEKLSRTCNEKIQKLKREISVYLRTISSNNDANSQYIKGYLKLLFYELLKDLESGDNETQEFIIDSLNILVKEHLVNCNVGQIEGAKYFYNSHCLKESQNHNTGNLIELIENAIATKKELIFYSVTMGKKEHNVHYITKWRPYFKDILGISQSIEDICFIGREVKYELRKGEILDFFFEKFKIEKMVNEIMASINSSKDLLDESLQYLKIVKDKETEANLKKNDDRENELYLNYNKTIKEYFEYTISSLDIDEDVENSTFCHTKIKYTGVLKILMLMNLILEGEASNVKNIETAGNNASISAI